MRLRTTPVMRTALLAAGVAILTPTIVIAADCSVAFSGSSYDLTKIDGQHSFTTEHPSPPTTTKTLYTISLCSPLPTPSPPSEDTCPEGTHLCMISLSTRSGLEDRVISVVPVAGEIGSGELQLSGRAADTTEGEGWVLEMHGGMWNSQEQKVEILMKCQEGKTETTPTFKNYTSTTGLLQLEWITGAACATSGSTPPPTTPPPKQDKSKKDDSSGMGFFGWFFTLFFLSLFAYFALGSYHNYTTYGAQGWDMIPHRDVWRDLPYVVGDLLRGRGGNRSGYSALS